MRDDRDQITDANLDQILRAAGDRLEFPPMRDAVAPARAVIESRASTAPRQQLRDGRPESLELAPDVIYSGDSAELPHDDQTDHVMPVEPGPSRLRELGLLAAGVAAAAALVLALVAVFGGLSSDGSDGDRPGAAPELGPAYEIPGFEYAGAYGSPKVPNEPIDVAIGEDGTRYVADVGLDRIVAFTPEGKRDTDWGDEGLSPEVIDPQRIAVGPDGSLYVVNNQVSKLTADGTAMETWQLPSASGGIVREDIELCGSAIDTDSAGNVYALCGTGSGFVQWEYMLKWSPDGDLIDATHIAVLEATSIAIDSQDRIYLGTASGEIHIAGPDGTRELPPSVPLDGIDSIASLVIGSDDTLVAVVADSAARGMSTVVRLDPVGNELGRWILDDKVTVAGSVPFGALRVATSHAGEVYVPDIFSHRVLVYSLEGDLKAEISDERSGTFGQLWRVAASGDAVYGLDPTVGGAINGFGPDGDLLREIDVDAAAERAPDDPLFSSTVAAADEGSLVFADASQSRIVAYSSDGALVAEWDPTDSESAAFPSAIAVDNDAFIYTVDEAGGGPKKFRLDGEFVASLGDRGSTLADIVYHNGAVWMTDGGSISRHPVDGGEPEVITESIFGAGGATEQGLVLSLDLDPEGNIYAFGLAFGGTDAEPVATSVLTKLDPEGRVLWSEVLATGRELYVDIAIGPDGTLYLADSDLHQILAYRPVEPE